jgi:hypothetical protein
MATMKKNKASDNRSRIRFALRDSQNFNRSYKTFAGNFGAMATMKKNNANDDRSRIRFALRDSQNFNRSL